MAVFAISDLHLAFGVDKPMDIFGPGWAGYMKRIEMNWIETVNEEDYVIIPGDISWATYLEQAVVDFRFINSLPGMKIISKGNHDYWWTTSSKLEKFLDEYGFDSIRFMHNNSYNINDILLCGTRGWKCPGDDNFSGEDRKIYNRELQRLEISLKSASKNEGNILAVAMHYPPFNSKKEPTEFVELMKQYGADMCIYGHLHGEGIKNNFQGLVDNIEFKLISADYLEFVPLKIY